MTPVINIAKKNKISYKIREYEHDPASESYGLEAAEKLGLSEERVFKSLGLLDGCPLLFKKKTIILTLNRNSNTV